jgi:hypothetical protein
MVEPESTNEKRGEGNLKNLCENCLKDDCKNKCGSCKSVYYCSTECQKKNWEKHKLICKKKTSELFKEMG